MKKIRISLVLNIIIVLLVILGSIFMFTGFKFMPSNSKLEAGSIEMFRYFTVDSNILAGIVSLVMIIYEIKLLNNKISTIPDTIYILKFISTSAVSLTFLTTAIFLTPQYGIYNLYSNTNLFFHLIVPLLAIISYISLENHNSKYKYAILGIIPMFIYSIYYVSMIIVNLNNGGLTYKYDFYGFLRGNINNAYMVLPIMYLVTYLISLTLIKLNKVLNNKKN